MKGKVADIVNRALITALVGVQVAVVEKKEKKVLLNTES